MEVHRFLCLLLVLFTGFLCSSQAYKFNVGGKDGWVLQPSENYNHWAESNRFQVNDTLFFKYKKGSDSVLIVSKNDYYNCNKDKPIMKMDGGDSVFNFDRSGPFFFISGNNGTCEKGQRLIVVVLAVRHPKSPPPPVGQVPATAPPPKGTTPVSPSSAPGKSPTLPPPVPKTPVLPPTTSPTPATTPLSPTPATTPISPAPATTHISLPPATTPTSPSPAPSMTPILPTPSGTTPAVSPAPAITPVSLSPTPMTSTPVSSPPVEAPVTAPSSTETSSPPSPAPAGDESLAPGVNPGGPNKPVTTPAPSPSAAAAVTPLSLFVSAVTVVLSVAVSSFINAP